MTTQYPSKIDNNISLPDAIDNITPVKAEVVNRLKQAIIAIENELGVKPSGIYSTLKARLANTESVVSNLDIIELEQDLGGSLSAPEVVGIRGIPVSNVSPNSGEVLVYNGLAWVPTAPDTAAGAFDAAGDLSGSNISQTVIKINGATVPIAGSLTTNHILKVSGAAATSYGYIVNANVDAAAAIAYSKLNLATSIVNADISSSAAIDYSKLGVGSQTIGAQQFTSTVDAKGVIVDVQPKNVQTTNATVTTLDSFTIATNTTLIISAVITAVKSDNSQGASYIRTAAFRNNAGTVAQISTTQDGGTFEDDATWDATIDNLTTTIRIRVTGKAATTIRWTCVSSRVEVIA